MYRACVLCYVAVVNTVIYYMVYNDYVIWCNDCVHIL